MPYAPKRFGSECQWYKLVKRAAWLATSRAGTHVLCAAARGTPCLRRAPPRQARATAAPEAAASASGGWGGEEGVGIGGVLGGGPIGARLELFHS